MRQRPIEILAPAGSIEGLYASLDMGADAVYVGTRRFGARAFAKNPDVEQIRQALTYAHLRGKKIYLTVNTLLTEQELEEELYPLIQPLYQEGLDACIVQDVGVMSYLHEYFPDMDLHASTQMTLFSGKEANLFQGMGVTRYVPARELSIAEIREAREQTSLEIEVFVHGALCYCYSGQCLMSEVIGGRSGNRGMCAQPCRLFFRSSVGNGHLLNTKDTCTLFAIPELVDAGIDSFKIEGRMKKKEYSAGMAYLYRKYTDRYRERGREYFETLKEDKSSCLWQDYKRCQDIYNRGGFSSGFLFEEDKKMISFPQKNNHCGLAVGSVVEATKKRACFELFEPIHYQDILEFRSVDGNCCYEYTVKNEADPGEIVTTNVLQASPIIRGQTVYRTRNQQLLDEWNQKIKVGHKKIPIRGRFIARCGQKARLEIEAKETRVMVEGAMVERASSRPVSEDDIEKKLGALGGTDYEWETLSIECERDVFIPISSLKSLRREAIAQWEYEAVGHRKLRDPEPFLKGAVQEPVRLSAMVSVADVRQLKEVLSLVDERVLVHLKLEDLPPTDWEECIDLADGRKLCLSLPRILHGEKIRTFMSDWEKYGKKFTEETVGQVVVDSHFMYLFAGEHFPEAEWIAGEHLYQKNERAKQVYGSQFHLLPAYERSYGRIPVMVSESCVRRTMGQCEHKKQRLTIVSPKGDEFVVVNHCRYCYNTIYTKKAVENTERKENFWLDFTWEEPAQVREVIKKWHI